VYPEPNVEVVAIMPMPHRLLSSLAALSPAAAVADWQLNLTPGVTSVSRNAYDLHMLVLWICTIIGVLVFGVMFWSILHHRKSRGAKAAHFHESTTVEIVWTLVPFLILVGLAVPATRALIHIEDASDADMSILVTGYQWKWHYRYLEDEVEFFSSLDPASNRARQLGSGQDPASVENYLLAVDNPVVVPVGKKIRFLTTANDVIHAWWVPALGFKRDAIPGFVNESWALIETPGIYRGQCAELCGRDHGFMPIVVDARPVEEYAAWVADFKAKQQAAAQMQDPSRSWSREELTARGGEVYAAHCADCHAADGSAVGGPGPSLAGGEVTLGAIDDLVDLLLFGNGEMHAFGDRLSDIDIAAVITYVRNSFGNSAGDDLQPLKVAEFR
jgi:cytochrome c oxidase subunit 2